MYYIRVKDEEEYEAVVDFMVNNGMNVSCTDDVAEFIAEELVNHYKDNKSNLDKEEVEQLENITTRFDIVSALSHSIQNEYKPGTDKVNGLIKAIIYEDK